MSWSTNERKGHRPSLNRDGRRHRLSATYDPRLTESRVLPVSRHGRVENVGADLWEQSIGYLPSSALDARRCDPSGGLTLLSSSLDTVLTRDSPPPIHSPPRKTKKCSTRNQEVPGSIPATPPILEFAGRDVFTGERGCSKDKAAKEATRRGPSLTMPRKVVMFTAIS
ncbi:hypothetical protein Bbelb_068030 [Branchiostoma belcheri]|nr:hypothetical protein Bbelb_068030 [Branchiostoma belcheri]